MKQHDQRWESQCMWQDCAKAGEEQQLDMFLSAKEKNAVFFKRFFFFLRPRFHCLKQVHHFPVAHVLS